MTNQPFSFYLFYNENSIHPESRIEKMVNQYRTLYLNANITHTWLTATECAITISGATKGGVRIKVSRCIVYFLIESENEIFQDSLASFFHKKSAQHFPLQKVF